MDQYVEHYTYEDYISCNISNIPDNTLNLTSAADGIINANIEYIPYENIIQLDILYNRR